MTAPRLTPVPAQDDASQHRRVASLALVDPRAGHRWLVDATPDFRAQLHALDLLSAPSGPLPALDGIFLTHAHIGHYTGLMHLGREVMGAHDVPVYAMPRMSRFLETSGPWSQLVDLHNVRLAPLQANRTVELGQGLGVTPLPVPHRDEFSETVGFRISGPSHSVLYIPDIDKWARWERSLSDVLATVDRAYLDGTFFDGDELTRQCEKGNQHAILKRLVSWVSCNSVVERRIPE